MLRRAYERLGRPHDVEGWIGSELSEGIPQLTRYRFLSTLWPGMIDCWGEGIERVPAAARSLAAGADRADLVRLARLVAYETVFAMLYHLADDHRDDCDDLPFWELTEVDPDGRHTGRTVGGLYEDLLGLDPSGNEGADLFEPEQRQP